MISVSPLIYILAAIGPLSDILNGHDFELDPVEPRVYIGDHCQRLLDALRLPPSVLLAEQPGLHADALSLTGGIPETAQRLAIVQAIVGKSYAQIAARDLLLVYCAALLIDPADPSVAMTLGIIDRLTATPVVDVGDVDPTPNVAPAVLTQTGDVVGGGG